MKKADIVYLCTSNNSDLYKGIEGIRLALTMIIVSIMSMDLTVCWNSSFVHVFFMYDYDPTISDFAIRGVCLKLYLLESTFQLLLHLLYFLNMIQQYKAC